MTHTRVHSGERDTVTGLPLILTHLAAQPLPRGPAWQSPRSQLSSGRRSWLSSSGGSWARGRGSARRPGCGRDLEAGAGRVPGAPGWWNLAGGSGRAGIRTRCTHRACRAPVCAQPSRLRCTQAPGSPWLTPAFAPPPPQEATAHRQHHAPHRCGS